MAQILVSNPGSSLGKRITRGLAERGHTVPAENPEILVICGSHSIQQVKDLVKQARSAKTTHIILISSKGASPHTKNSSLVTTYEQELIVRQSSIPCTILRPGILVSRWLQPAYTEDLVDSIASAVDAKPENAVREIPGPEQLTLRETLTLVKKAVKQRFR